MKKRVWTIIGFVLPLMLAVICMLPAFFDNHQAMMGIPLKPTFNGEYSRDGVHWYPLTEENVISATEGDLYVRGYFCEEIYPGARLNFFRNHIGARMYVNGELLAMDIREELKEYGAELHSAFCGKDWMFFFCNGIGTEDLVEFRLSNPHGFGNRDAYRQFLDTLYVSANDSDIMESYLKPYTQPFQMLGSAFLLIGFVLAGAALASVLLKSNIGGLLIKFGLLSGLAGGYIMMDTVYLISTTEQAIIRTYGRQIFMMLAVFYLGIIIKDTLHERYKKIVSMLLWISCGVNAVLLVLSLFDVLLLYDTQFFWGVSQWILCPVLAVYCIKDMMADEKKRNVVSVAFILLLATILLDFTGIGNTGYYQGLCSKIAFVLFSFFYLVTGAKAIILNHHASAHAKRLEEELTEMRIATMLSQIKPHFIYNTLGTIEQFCYEEPEQAANLVHEFSLYLRGNFTELDNSAPIRVTQELEHVKHYVGIEQVRFPDITIEYDIREEDFLVPALSVQPLVENAVKHGLMGLESGGTVKISTYETMNAYCISVTDDGIGFEEGVLDDGQPHVGIRNIRARIEAMCEGKLVITSKPGKGTMAVISIPKEVKE